MVAAVLALASSMCWGLSDFLGGLQSRRHNVLAVLVLSQALALTILVVAVLAGAGTDHDGAATAWALSVGVAAMIALGSFYRALAIGTMSIVAPISATGVAIPVVAGLLSGERPGPLQLAGIALACCGVVLAAREAPSADPDERRDSRAAIGLALVAAVGFGTFFTGMDKAEETADVAWVLLCARGTSVAAVVIAALALRPPLPRAPVALGALAAVGVFDLLANFLFVLATGRGLLSVVGVLGSLYPAVTVILARFVLQERISRLQLVGVVTALAGVVLISGG
jgi:drug/metabolite transporter (DMT)-like permease